MMSSQGAAAVGGNSNVAGQTEVMELTAASQLEYVHHQQLQLELEAKKRAFQLTNVPTLNHEVRATLRSLGCPVRLFGENLQNVRDRLRYELAKREIYNERNLTGGVDSGTIQVGDLLHQQHPDDKSEADEEQITKYSRAQPELIRAREQFAQYSLQRSCDRLDRERNYRLQWQRKRSRLNTISPDNNDNDDNDDESLYSDVTRIDEVCVQTYKWIRNAGLEGSQYGDSRPLSAMCTSRSSLSNNELSSSSSSSASLFQNVIATGSWSGTIKLWDGTSPELKLLNETTMAHEDRIMGIALQPQQQPSSSSPSSMENDDGSLLLATASIDTTAKLWKVSQSLSSSSGPSEDNNEDAMSDDDNTNDGGGASTASLNVEEVAHLKGHARRLCKVSFHPQGRHVATTSFDHTWRLWDCETGQEVLLQDGHWKEVYGVGFHHDGSLCSTTDYGSVVQLWDLRTGKSIHHFEGHARRVLCAEFSPNGFHLATAGDDGTIKIWDLRKRKQFVSLPAHSKLVTQLRFDYGTTLPGGHGGDIENNPLSGGEYLVSSSFDGTAKVWSARDWKLLSTLRGHEGKVMAVDILPQQKSVVTCGFDKTLKLWR